MSPNEVGTTIVLVIAWGAAYPIYRRFLRPRMIRDGLIPANMKIPKVLWLMLAAYLVVVIGAGVTTWVVTGSALAGLGAAFGLMVVLQIAGTVSAARRAAMKNQARKAPPVL